MSQDDLIRDASEYERVTGEQTVIPSTKLPETHPVALWVTHYLACADCWRAGADLHRYCEAGRALYVAAHPYEGSV